ncbi:MAG: PqqD family protein [Gemmatimonadota bacterium]
MTAPLPFEDLCPVRRHRAEDRDGDLVTVLVPKFTSRFARRWFVPLLAKPDLRVHLDALGSFVWRQCDGTASLREIAGRVAERFGRDPDDALRQVVRFVRKLAREESLTFHPPGAPA